MKHSTSGHTGAADYSRMSEAKRQAHVNTIILFHANCMCFLCRNEEKTPRRTSNIWTEFAGILLRKFQPLNSLNITTEAIDDLPQQLTVEKFHECFLETLVNANGRKLQHCI